MSRFIDNDEVVEWIKQRAGNSSFLDLGYDIVVSVGSKYSGTMRQALKREQAWHKKQKKIEEYLAKNTGEWKDLKVFLEGMPESKWGSLTYLKLIVRPKNTEDKRYGYLGKTYKRAWRNGISFVFNYGSDTYKSRLYAEDFNVFITEDNQAKILATALGLKK